MNENKTTLLEAVSDALASMFYLGALRIGEPLCYAHDCATCETSVTFNGAILTVTLADEENWFRADKTAAADIAATILDRKFHDIEL